MWNGSTNTVDVARDPRRRPASESNAEKVQEPNENSTQSTFLPNDPTPWGGEEVEVVAAVVVAETTNYANIVPPELIPSGAKLKEENGTNFTAKSITEGPDQPTSAPSDTTPWAGPNAEVTVTSDQPTAIASEPGLGEKANEVTTDAILPEKQLIPTIPNGSHNHESGVNGNTEKINGSHRPPPRAPFQELKAPLAAGLTAGLSALVHRKSPNSESNHSERNTPLYVDDGSVEALKSPGYRPSIAAHNLLPTHRIDDLSLGHPQAAEFKPPVANMIRSSEEAQLDMKGLALADNESMEVEPYDLFMDASEHLDVSNPTEQATDAAGTDQLGTTDASGSELQKPMGALKSSKGHTSKSDRQKRLYSPSQSNYRPDPRPQDGIAGRQWKTSQYGTISERYGRPPLELYAHRTTGGLRPAKTHMDMSERLLNDQSMEVEYIKGQGTVLVRHNQATTTETPRPERPTIPNETFPLIHYKSRARKITMRQLKWNSDLDGFEIPLDGDEKVIIHAEAVKTVYYDFESRKFYLFPNSAAPAEKRIEELILEIGGTDITPFRLRSILEQRFGAVNVAKRPMDWFFDKEIDFDRPKKPIPMKPTWAKIQPRVSSAEENSSSSERDDNAARSFKAAAEVNNHSARTLSDTLKRKKKEQGPFKSRKRSREYSPEPTRKVPQRDRPASKKKREIEDVSANDSVSDRAAAGPVELQPLELHYVSGELVRLNDLVLRIREDVDLEDNKKKFDALDVYDGPFRVSEIPPAFIKKNDPYRDEFVAMQEKKVRLSFPEGSKGKPMTKLARLRPVYMIQADTPEGMDARGCYYWPKSKGREKIVVNDLGSDTDSDDDDDDEEIYQNAGVACLQKGAYVRVHYISSQGAVEEDNGTLFEVEKLRDKKIERCSRDEFPDENMDDPIIVQYLQNGGILDESEVLVVRYLVHWAGWPSEDDTYERAQDNIPDVFIQAYEARNGPDAVVPKPRGERAERGEKGEKVKRGRKKGRKTI